MLLVIALISGGTGGCAKRIEYVYVEPVCSVPPLPRDLPRIDVDGLYDALEAYHGVDPGRQMAEALRKRERLIVDSLMEHRAVVTEICGKKKD